MRLPTRPLSFRPSPYLLLAGSSLFWAGNFIVGRAIRGDVPPVALNFWRWAIALLILLPAGLPLMRRHAAPLWRSRGLVLVLAASGVAGFQSLVYEALTQTTAINALLIMTITPVCIALLSWLFWREQLGFWPWVGVLLSLAGALTVIARGEPGRLLEVRLNGGDLWMAAAVWLWALYSVLLRRRPADLPLMPLLVACVLVGLLLLLPLYGWRLHEGERMVLHPPTLLGLLYVGIFPSAVAFTFWNRGVAAVGATIAGMFLHLMPLFGAVLAVLFLGERLAPFHAVGALLVAAGIALTSRR